MVKLVVFLSLLFWNVLFLCQREASGFQLVQPPPPNHNFGSKTASTTSTSLAYKILGGIDDYGRDVGAVEEDDVENAINKVGNSLGSNSGSSNARIGNRPSNNDIFEMHLEPMRHWNEDVLELTTRKYEPDGSVSMPGTAWEASSILVDYMTHPDTGLSWEDTSVVELGSGIGLAAIVAALMGARVVATDAMTTSLDLISDNSVKHQDCFRHPLQVQPLLWGDYDAAYQLLQEGIGGYPDIILAADVIYCQSNRDGLKATIEALAGPETWIIFAHAWRTQPDVDQAFFDSFADQFERIEVDPAMMPPGYQSRLSDGRTPVVVYLFRRR